jgi:hypothetical protein
MVITFRSRILDDEFTHRCPWFIRVLATVALEEYSKVGISAPINVWKNMMINKGLIATAPTQSS